MKKKITKMFLHYQRFVMSTVATQNVVKIVIFDVTKLTCGMSNHQNSDDLFWSYKQKLNIEPFWPKTVTKSFFPFKMC